MQNVLPFFWQTTIFPDSFPMHSLSGWEWGPTGPSIFAANEIQKYLFFFVYFGIKGFFFVSNLQLYCCLANKTLNFSGVKPN